MLAPRSVELNQPRHFGIEHMLIEISVGEYHHVLLLTGAGVDHLHAQSLEGQLSCTIQAIIDDAGLLTVPLEIDGATLITSKELDCWVRANVIILSGVLSNSLKYDTPYVVISTAPNRTMPSRAFADLSNSGTNFLQCPHQGA